MSDRKVLVLAHTGRPAALSVAEELLGRLSHAGVTPLVLPDEAQQLSAGCLAVSEYADPDDPLDHAELVIVLGCKPPAAQQASNVIRVPGGVRLTPRLRVLPQRSVKPGSRHQAASELMRRPVWIRRDMTQWLCA